MAYPLTLAQWLPNPATSLFPIERRSLRELWSPEGARESAWVLPGGGWDVGVFAEGAEAGEEMGAGGVFDKAEGGGFVRAFEGGFVRGIAIFDFVVFARSEDVADFAAGDFLVVETGVGQHRRREEGRGGGVGVLSV